MNHNQIDKLDGRELDSGFTEGKDTIRDMIKYLKESVDRYLDNGKQ